MTKMTQYWPLEHGEVGIFLHTIFHALFAELITIWKGLQSFVSTLTREIWQLIYS